MWWKILVPVISAALISWGAYMNAEVVKKANQQELTEHKQNDNSRFYEIQKTIREQGERIEDKLDRIQEKL